MINGVEENIFNNSSNNSSNNNSDSDSDSNSENDSNNTITHVMYIKNIQKYTKLHICPKCGYIHPPTDHGSYHKERFEEHIQNCEGKTKKITV
jgi:hypothetical protein